MNTGICVAHWESPPSPWTGFNQVQDKGNTLHEGHKNKQVAVSIDLVHVYINVDSQLFSNILYLLQK